MKKRKLFLIIGLIRDGRYWDEDFVQNLKDLYNVDEVNFIDLPGSGEYHEVKSHLTVAGMVHFLREDNRIKIEDSPEDNLLVSISLGGMIAMEWLSLYPNDFKKCIVINSSFKEFSPLLKRVQPQAIREFFKVFLSKTAEEREKGLLELCSNNKLMHKKTLNNWISISKSDKRIKKSNMIRQVIAGTTTNPKKREGPEILLIAAKYDKLAHYTCSVEISKKWGVDLIVNDDPNVGHAFHVDAPKWLANEIHKWDNN